MINNNAEVRNIKAPDTMDSAVGVGAPDDPLSVGSQNNTLGYKMRKR